MCAQAHLHRPAPATGASHRRPKPPHRQRFGSADPRKPCDDRIPREPSSRRAAGRDAYGDIPVAPIRCVNRSAAALGPVAIAVDPLQDGLRRSRCLVPVHPLVHPSVPQKHKAC